MQAVQLVTAVLAVAAAASAFPGFSESSSHVSHPLGGDLGGLGGHGGYDGGHDSGHEDYYARPEYKYDYAVHDPHTGDVKSASESRSGDSVQGSYTVHDADGHVRTVEYTANKHTGFQAVVKKGGEVTVHGFGEQDKQNVAQAHAASTGASYSNSVNHGYSGGHGNDLGEHTQVSYGGHGY